MSTRANIIRKNLDDSFDLIYIQFDGYPSHHAPILLECYSYSAVVENLLALGDLSSLTADLSFCRTIGQDLDEPETAMQHFADAGSLKAYLDEAWTEWIYVWDEHVKEWYFTNNPSPTWLKLCGGEQLPLHKLNAWQEIAK